MRTYIIPSRKIALTAKSQPVLTFTDSDNLPAKGVSPTSEPNPARTFRSKSEESRKNLIIRDEIVLETLENKIADLKKNIETLKLEHTTLLESQKSEFENLQELKKQESEKSILDAKEQKEKILAEAEEQAQAKLQEVTLKSEELITEAKRNVAQIEKQAQETGYKKGLTQSSEENRAEAARLHELIKKVLEECIKERSRLIKRSEAHVIDLCLLMVKKIVKEISDQDNTLVIRTIKEALKRTNGLVNIKILVNTIDWKLSERSKKDFYKMHESIENVVIMEDPAIEPGGCVIESDFGAIDARLSSQLQKLELAVRELSPIQPSV